MRALCSFLLLLLSSTAFAQVPGTFDDPVLSLGVLPEVADAPLAQEVVVRGEPAEILFEGFTIPTAFHHRLRSIVTYDSKLGWDQGVEHTGATHFLNITAPSHLPMSAQVTSIDVAVSTLRAAPFNTDDTTRYFDAMIVVPYVKAIITEKFARIVAAKEFRRAAWRFRIAGSPLVDDTVRFDSRTDVEYRGPAAGLQRLAWRLGIDTSNTEVAGWTSANALLSKIILARAGVRVDGDSIQSRGSLEVELPGKTVSRIEAGAFRRGDARTTELAAKLAHTHGPFGFQLTGYYQDRLEETVTSTAGVEVISSVDTHRWLAFVSASYAKQSKATTFDQPMRVDVVGKYKAQRWSVGARMELSSGLPYRPVVESSYDSDTDSYQPIFALRRERLPFHHELSVRFDMRFGPHVRAFADVRNVYAADTTLGYAYSYDYKTRVATTLPILPFVGVRGEM